MLQAGQVPEIRTTKDAEVTQREAELMTRTAAQSLRVDMHWGLSSGSKVTRYESRASLLGDCLGSPPSTAESKVEVLVDVTEH
jgi:hypothetical protein